MPGKKRLLELALKGLEAERQRFDEEIADLQKQLHGGGGTASARREPKSQPRAVTGRQSGTRLTAAGRKALSDAMKRRWAVKKRAGAMGKKK